ncbi:hypothetical protein [Halosegnis marinus]|uniref:hypothetical protein n=1 Tax=Halosegnis marinus TaxID=3034023 RepID=UPI003608D1B6
MSPRSAAFASLRWKHDHAASGSLRTSRPASAVGSGSGSIHRNSAAGSKPVARDCPSPAPFHENTMFRQTVAPCSRHQSNIASESSGETPSPR